MTRAQAVEPLIARLEDPEQYVDALDGPDGAIATLRQLAADVDTLSAALRDSTESHRRIQTELQRIKDAVIEARQRFGAPSLDGVMGFPRPGS